MATLNEISLFAGLFVSALFYFQYKQYEKEISKAEMLDQFLND